MKYEIISLGDVLSNYSNEEIIKVFDTFESKNKDVEHFLKCKAIEFEKVGMSRTTLVFSDNKLMGYFSISTKPLVVNKKNWSRLSNSVKRKLSPMSNKSEQGNHEISSILLGQLSKNSKYQESIDGDHLLGYAYNKIRELWKLGGGRFLYVEVDKNDKLDKFYNNNGFKRLIIKDESNNISPFLTVNGQWLYVKKLKDI